MSEIAAGTICDVLAIGPIAKEKALWLVVERHYLHRRTSVSFAFGLYVGARVVGVVTFGVPASRHVQIGACPSNPSLVIELNRLWIEDEMPRNTATWFLSRVMAELPPYIVVSYADTTVGHMGFVYRAANFKYAGWTDMERRKARYDYITPGKHTRETFRSGEGAKALKVRRKPKVKYWTVTGDRRQRRKLVALCGWPSMDWREVQPPTEHQQLVRAPHTQSVGVSDANKERK